MTTSKERAIVYVCICESSHPSIIKPHIQYAFILLVASSKHEAQSRKVNILS